MKITSVSGHKILASLGDETIEATILFDGGQTMSASVPAGLSAGKYEVPKAPVPKALEEIATINSLLAGKDWFQETLDNELALHQFGGNSTLAVSAAFFKANLKPLGSAWQPKIFLLAFEGGLHGSKSLTIQEFIIVEDTIASSQADFTKLKTHLDDHGISTTVGAEGGFSPKEYDNINVFNCLKEIFPDKLLAIDVAASANLFQETLAINLDSFLRHYKFASIEDPYGEDDWDKWADFTARHGAEIMVVGDDLTTTNPDRIRLAIEKKAINAIIIKPNQIGTISKAFEAVKVARDGDLKVIVSHRGDETDDHWIADFAQVVQADYVKFGGLDRGERIAKYNRLLELGVK